jgi:acyl-CoA thioesterase-1
VGTSLTAGHGLELTEAFPAVFQRKLDAADLSYRVVNAGVSGETSAGALRRIDWLLRQPVAVLVLETGANDGLRGQDPEATRANIQAIFDRARQQDPPPKLALVAMEALPNYGEEPRAEPARRNPPQRRGPAARRRERLEDPGAFASVVRGQVLNCESVRR